MGLQAVDGLDTSDYLKNIAKQNIEGEITLSEAGRLIESYYEESKESDADRTKEADIVSARIAAILSERRLFFQCLSISEFTEGCLKESTPMLEYDIRTENEYEYPLNSISDIIPHLARFVSRLWQIHAFGEGNTRTTAVFFIKYLRSMGFDVTNDIFAANSWYFRNSLVRANYNDLSKGIRETTEFLELFLRNLLLGESNELKNRYMHVRWKMQKQDIQGQKQDIQGQKQDMQKKEQHIEVPDDVSNKTKQHIQVLFERFGYDQFFGRTEVMSELSITASPASALIKKMLDWGVIYPMKGKGKGKYLFRRN